MRNIVRSSDHFNLNCLLYIVTESFHWKPKCYLAREDLLILEDLNLSGYRHLAHRTRFDRPFVECVLRSVAAIHAESIAFETRIYPKNILEVFNGYSDEFAIAPDKKWFQRGLDVSHFISVCTSAVFKRVVIRLYQAIKVILPLIPSYNKYADKYSSERFDELVSPVYEMVKPSSKYRNVFCHQDLWGGNIMFKFGQVDGQQNLSEPLSSVIMDYQFARYLPPVSDVLMFILMTTRLDHRRKHLSHYYRYYHECFCAELEKHELVADEILSWNDFQASCKDLKLFPIVFNCVGLPFTFYPNEIQMKIKSSSAEEFRRVREDNHYDYMIHHMKQDDEFKDVVLESMEELMETLFE